MIFEHWILPMPLLPTVDPNCHPVKNAPINLAPAETYSRCKIVPLFDRLRVPTYGQWILSWVSIWEETECSTWVIPTVKKVKSTWTEDYRYAHRDTHTHFREETETCTSNFIPSLFCGIWKLQVAASVPGRGGCSYFTTQKLITAADLIWSNFPAIDKWSMHKWPMGNSRKTPQNLQRMKLWMHQIQENTRLLHRYVCKGGYHVIRQRISQFDKVPVFAWLPHLGGM